MKNDGVRISNVLNEGVPLHGLDNAFRTHGQQLTVCVGHCSPKVHPMRPKCSLADPALVPHIPANVKTGGRPWNSIRHYARGEEERVVRQSFGLEEFILRLQTPEAHKTLAEVHGSFRLQLY